MACALHIWGRNYPLGKDRRLPWAPKSQGPPKILFIYEIRIKRGHTNGCCLRCLLPRQPSCVSELNMLLVYPACSKYEYNASEADCRSSARSLFPSVRTHLSFSLSRACFRSRSHSLSLSLHLLCSARDWKELCFQLKHGYVTSLILHARIVEITAQLSS